MPIPKRRLWIVPIVGLLALMPGVPAQAEDQGRNFCAQLPRSNWLSQEEVQDVLRQRGLRLLKLRMSGYRCYAALAQDQKGQSRFFILHPITADIIDSFAP